MDARTLCTDLSRGSATILDRKFRECIRSQVNTSLVAPGPLDGGALPRPYTTLPRVQFLLFVDTVANVLFAMFSVD
jgi:hypothetical protein